MSENQRQSAKHIAREDSLTRKVHEQFAQAKKKETKQVRLVQLIILLVFLLYGKWRAG